MWIVLSPCRAVHVNAEPWDFMKESDISRPCRKPCVTEASWMRTLNSKTRRALGRKINTHTYIRLLFCRCRLWCKYACVHAYLAPVGREVIVHVQTSPRHLRRCSPFTGGDKNNRILSGISNPLVTEQRFVVLSMAEKTHTYDSPMSVRDHVFDFCFAVIDCDVSVCVCVCCPSSHLTAEAIACIQTLCPRHGRRWCRPPRLRPRRCGSEPPRQLPARSR